jgi:hypothetical protein
MWILKWLANKKQLFVISKTPARQGFFITLNTTNPGLIKSIKQLGKKMAIYSMKYRYFVWYLVLFTVSQVHERFSFQQMFIGYGYC